MGLLSAWSRYQKLDDRQRDFMRTKILNASLTLDEWIRFLHPVGLVDREADVIRKFAFGGGILCMPMGIFAAVGFGSGWPLLALPMGIAMIVFANRMGRIDVPPVLAESVLPWLALLREDVAPGSEVRLALDLRGSECPPKRQVARSGDVNGAGWTTDVFLDPWFSGEATFADNAVVKWDVSDLVRRRTRSRRNPRGKVKTKTKHKVLRTFDVQVRVRGKDFHATPASDGASEAVRTDIVTGDKRTSVRARSRVLLARVDQPPRLVEMVDAVAAVYRHLTPADSRGANG